MTGSWTVLSRAEADRALRRLRAEHDDIAAALLALDRHPGRLLLDGAALTGVTAERYARVRRAQAVLWELFAAYGAALSRAEELRGRRGRPGRARLEELAEVLYGACVDAPAREVALRPGGLLGPGAEGGRLTMRQAVEEMTAAWDDAVACVAAAEEVWNRFLPSLDAVSARLAAAGRALEELGGPGALPAQAGALAALRARAEQARATLAGDPLSLAAPAPPETAGHGARADGGPAAPGTPGTPDTPGGQGTQDTPGIAGEEDPLGLAALGRELGDVEDQLKGFQLTRRHHAARIERVRAHLADLAREEDDAARLRERTAARVAGPLPRVPPASPALGAALREVEDLRAREAWQALSARLSALERDVAAARSRLGEAGAAWTAALARRDELRGLLRAYRAMAGSRGRGEDTDLDEAYARAADLLWHGPCDLDEAAEAVGRYQRAVTGAAARRPAATGAAATARTRDEGARPDTGARPGPAPDRPPGHDGGPWRSAGHDDQPRRRTGVPHAGPRGEEAR